MKTIITLIMSVMTIITAAQEKAKDFEATTMEGKPFRLSDMAGSKILLSFYRNGACALCNLRVHELYEMRDQLERAGIKVICVFESSIEDMKPYVGKQNVPFTLLSDPHGKLYTLYGITSSEEIIKQVMSSGSAGKRIEEAAKAGFALTPQENSNFYRIPADVLIDKNFTIYKTHHANQLTDHLSTDEIVKFGRL